MIQKANISWNAGAPYSNTYDDIYFNVNDGIAESTYVFLKGNNLNSRNFKSLSAPFIFAETGFGTGLNFLLTAQHFESFHPDKTMHFISTELSPLSREDLITAHKHWEELQLLSKRLTDSYPIEFNENCVLIRISNKISLELLIGDAAEAFTHIQSTVDAWYLDGFAPSKNPDMWSPELFEQIARLSKPGTTFSTFTAAGLVKRGLKAVGFDVQKQKGFGRKREMLIGTFADAEAPKLGTQPWFEIPASKKPKHAVVIGGGLAGCSTARALAERGIKVTLIEKDNTLASGGSGNRQGALYAKLPAQPTKQGQLHITGLLHTLNLLKRDDPAQTIWNQSGVIQLATNDKERKRQQSCMDGEYYPESLVSLKSNKELTELAGVDIQHSGLYFPKAGWVSPKDLCQQLSSHENIDIIQAEVISLEYRANQWSLVANDNKQYSATHVVICSAENANQFKQTNHLPLKTIRGQVSIAHADEAQSKLSCVVCGEGYISPVKDGKLCFGATFDLKGKKLDVCNLDHQENLKNLADILPDFAKKISANSVDLTGRTAFRCSTPDYMPIVGAAPVYDEYLNSFAQLRKDRKWKFSNAKPEHYPNLYVNTGHGSKGLITCPISSELLASIICNEALPLPKELIDMINPARFIIKNLIKQAI
ncbi:MAG: bifunctional tRNA (5-methylaminomethyl-2-thiouridine)(34)-methyltransferase MnmD/FAD-dependent 5-carboxymethylaminomethyl-2-thiouridine(34) oxidoreductase MnmC [Neptuniibacter sp.]